MTTLILTIALFLIVALVMSIGVLSNRIALQRSCGGMNVVMGENCSCACGSNGSRRSNQLTKKITSKEARRRFLEVSERYLFA